MRPPLLSFFRTVIITSLRINYIGRISSRIKRLDSFCCVFFFVAVVIVQLSLFMSLNNVFLSANLKPWFCRTGVVNVRLANRGTPKGGKTDRPFPSSPGPLYQDEVRCSALWEWFSFSCEIKLIFTREAVYVVSFWKWGVFNLTRKWTKRFFFQWFSYAACDWWYDLYFSLIRKLLDQYNQIVYNLTHHF